MNPLERALADELTRAANAAAAWPDPAGRVRAAAHRQHQRRVVAGAFAAVTGIVVAMALASPSGDVRGTRPHDWTASGTASPSPEPEASEPAGTPEPTGGNEPSGPGPTPEESESAEPAEPAGEEPSSDPMHTPTPRPTEPPRESPPSPTPSGELPPAPQGPGMQIGQRYRYDLHTHCGIEYAGFDGRTWRTEPLNDGNGNPPPGWGNPYQAGIVVLTAIDAARFDGDNGQTLEFTPAVRTPRPCD